MLAYKFLDRRGRAPFSGFTWPVGEWVTSADQHLCGGGVHGCRAEDVAIWLSDTMWVIELDEVVAEAPHKLVARRGRLVEPVPGYAEAMDELGNACAWRCRDRAVAASRRRHQFLQAVRLARATTLSELVDAGSRCDDLRPAGRLGALAADTARETLGRTAGRAPFIAACSAGHAAVCESGRDDDQDLFDAGYTSERRFQSDWLTSRLSLA